MVYASDSCALAALEYMVHLAELPKGLVLLDIEIPDTLKIEVAGWIPPDSRVSQQMGDEWLAAAETPC